MQAFINGFEPAAQPRTTAQNDFGTADRAVNGSLPKMKILGVKVAEIIDGQISGDGAIHDDLNDVFASAPR